MKSFKKRLSVLLACGLIVQSVSPASAALPMPASLKKNLFGVESQKMDGSPVLKKATSSSAETETKVSDEKRESSGTEDQKETVKKATDSNAKPANKPEVKPVTKPEKEPETDTAVKEPEDQPIGTEMLRKAEGEKETELEFAFKEEFIRGCVGQWIEFSSLMTGLDIPGEISFESSDKEIVETNSTSFELKKTGTAIITATLTLETGEALQTTLKVEVVTRQLKFTTNDDPIRVKLGQEQDIPLDKSYLGYYAPGYGELLSYEIGDGEILHVTAKTSGADLIKGLKVGTTTLTVKTRTSDNLSEKRDIEVYTDVELGEVTVERSFPDATELSWKMENTPYYRIERAKDGENFRIIFNGEDGTDKNSYVDRNLAPGAVYHYRVSALTQNEVLGERLVVDTKEVDVTVNEKKVDFNHPRIYVNETYQLEPTYTGYDGEELAEVTWSSENPEIAKVDDTGKVTGVKAGTTKITLRLEDGNERTNTIYVEANKEVSNLDVVVNYNQYIKLVWSDEYLGKAYIVYRRENGGEWQKLSEDRKSGFLDETALSGHTYQYKVVVVAKNYATSGEFETPGAIIDVTVSNHAARLLSELVQVRKGEIYDLPLEITGFDTQPQLKCSSSDENVATVNAETRKVTVVGEGRAEITIELQDGPVLVCTYFCVERPVEMCTQTEWSVFTITNQNRMNENHDPLTMFPQMQEATDIRKEELTRMYSHTRPSGQSCFTVFEEVGLDSWGAGENIAMGYRSPEAVMNGWMNSPGHYRNIMGNFEHFATGEMNFSWVQMFMGCRGDMDLIAMAPAAGNRTFRKGTQIEDFGEIVVVNCKTHGNTFMPLISKMCTGYDPNKVGEQTISVHYKDKTTTFTVTIEGSGSGSGSGGSGSGGSGGSGGGSGSGGSGGSGGGSGSGGSGGSGGGGGSSRGGSSGGGPGSGSGMSFVPVVTGTWIKDTIGWWLEGADKSYPKSQWAQVNGTIYHFNDTGYMTEGWFAENGRWYYLIPGNGAMATGWIQLGEIWYYLNADGAMAVGWVQDPNSAKWYYLGADGAMLANTITPDGYVIGADGAWIQ